MIAIIVVGVVCFVLGLWVGVTIMAAMNNAQAADKELRQG